MADSAIIFDATAVCLENFNDCLTVEVLMRNEWAENRLADFNLWASGTGASARGRASLDSRLALQAEARDVIANLLRLLAVLIDECKKLGRTKPSSLSRQLLMDARYLAALSATDNLLTDDSHDGEGRGRLATLSSEAPPARSFSPWSDDSASDAQSETEFRTLSARTPLHKNMSDVKSMLGQLASIAVAVGRSGRRSRLQKADHRFNPDEHKDLQKHLTTVLLARPEFSKEQIDPSRLTEVQQRLIYCNLKRRNRFLYAQQHTKELVKDTAGRSSLQTQAIEPIQARSLTDREAPEKKLKSLWRIENPLGEAADTSVNPITREGTSASAVGDSFALPQTSVLASAASTVVSSNMINLKYPNPPKIKEGARTYKCPCCCQVLPTVFLENKRWL